MILCSNPLAGYLAHRKEIDAAIERVLNGGRYILGEAVENFEASFAHYLGVPETVGVGSGTEALHAALAACGVGPGDEVITVSHTAVATVAAIELTGATPMLADIESAYYTIDPGRVEELVSSRTKAVVAVHLYGQPADLDPLLSLARDRDLSLIEDCAQAHGARYRERRIGAWGRLSCFSFYPTKNLGALGDGGLVAGADSELLERVRKLRQYGWGERYVSEIAGWNSRLDEIQAAILGVKLAHLEADNSRRRRLADIYRSQLDDLDLQLPLERPNSSHVFHLFVIRSDRRDELQAFLRKKGIAALVHYPVPVHMQPAYRDRLPLRCPLDRTEAVSRQVLSLPLYPELTEQDQARTIEAVRAFFRGQH